MTSKRVSLAVRGSSSEDDSEEEEPEEEEPEEEDSELEAVSNQIPPHLAGVELQPQL